MNEWTNCEDKLPEEGVLVLTYDKPEKYLLDYIVYLDEIKKTYIWSRRNIDKDVHWMPLPEPPNEE